MYENSRFLKNRYTFCGVNTNFGQQWAPPAYYHLTPIVSKGKHCKQIHVVSMSRHYHGHRPKQNGYQFADSIFNFLNENYYIWLQISLKYVPRGIDLLHKSYNAPVSYPTLRHFVTEMCMCAHFCYKMVHCGIIVWCIMGFVIWDNCHQHLFM